MTATNKKLEKGKKLKNKEKKIKAKKVRKVEISGKISKKEKNVVPPTNSNENTSMQISSNIDYNSLQKTFMLATNKKLEKAKKLKKEQKIKGKKIRKVEISGKIPEKGTNVVPSTSSNENTNMQISSGIDYNSLQILRYRISEKFNSERHLFLKKDPTNHCSLIIANIPPYITLVTLGRILAELGSGRPDETIAQRGTAANDKITEGFYTASARLKSEDAVEQALLNCEKIPFLCLSSMDVELTHNGAAKLCDEYRKSFKTVTELQENVDSYMKKHDAKILEEKQKAKKMANVPDEDGWITVTKSHYKPVPRAIVVKNKEDLLKLSKKKKRVEESIAFYSFQLKQSKLKHLEELRRKFAEDKKKLAIAKAARKFRPT
uniref:RRP7 domain-containing protein n=1 Tax=Onchocerca volvulus TaxID=6282 RepID=A0A2K6VJJ4_ONCVO